MTGAAKLVKFFLLSLIVHGVAFGAASSFIFAPAQISFPQSPTYSTLSLSIRQPSTSLVEPNPEKTQSKPAPAEPPAQSPEVTQERARPKKHTSLSKKTTPKKIIETDRPEATAPTAASAIGNSQQILASAVEAPRPPYPLAARRRGVEGKVTLKVQITRTGAVEKVNVLKTSGRRDFDQSAYDTVLNHWKFSPALMGGVPVETSEVIEIVFVLR